MSLANVLAVIQAAHSNVLLGDPQQLEQPKKGTHPEGVGLSALQHMLGSHVTIPTGRGIFLPETWRLSRVIAAFTSEVFYEGRLRAKPGLERQQLVGSAFAGGALWAVDVNHEGNRVAKSKHRYGCHDGLTDVVHSPSVRSGWSVAVTTLPTFALREIARVLSDHSPPVERYPEG